MNVNIDAKLAEVNVAGRISGFTVAYINNDSVWGGV